jgi:putative colanic acid biosynthesis glycosyltransferase WcaI
MKVAVLTQYFDPEPSTRITDMTRHLAESGVEVEVLTSLPNLPHGRLYEGYKYSFCRRERRFGVSVFRAFVWPYRGRQLIKRIIHFLIFAVSASICSVRLFRFDVLYVFHPPLTIAIPAIALKWLHRRPMIYDVADIWPEAGVAAGAISKGLLYRSMEAFAGFVYKQADVVCVIAPEFRDMLLLQGVPEKKLAVIPNWADEKVCRPVPKGDYKIHRGLPPDSKIVTYLGNFGSTHGVEVILHAARLLQSAKDVFWVFAGSGAEYSRIAGLSGELGLTNTKFLGYIETSEEYNLLIANSDLMLVHLRRGPADALSLPSRILSYMACGRPILAAAVGAPVNLISRAACGFCCEPENSEVLAETVLTATRDQELLNNLGLNGRHYYHAALNKDRAMSSFVELIRQVNMRA